MNPLQSQVEASNALSSLKVGALFMEPGTGKTRAAMDLVRSVGGIDFVLWLCPFQTKANLREEVAKHGGFECAFEVLGIESMSSSDSTYLRAMRLLKMAQKPFLVVDESLKIKNWEAIRTKRIIELGRCCEYKLILNGTPLSRDLLDLWAQMEFLSPKILRMSLAEFKGTFCRIVRKTITTGSKRIVREFIDDYVNIDHLHSLVDPYVFRYDLRLGVGKQYRSVGYDLSDEELQHYNDLKHWFLDPKRLAMLSNNIFMMMTQKMQHSYCTTLGKLEAIAKIASTCDPDRTIIYTKFVQSREAIKDLFPDMQVLTYGKHSLGLNMQHAHTIIFADKTFDYAQRVQSERRIYRTGQTSECTYHDLTGRVGLEALIDRNILRKTSLLEYFREKGAEIVKEL